MNNVTICKKDTCISVKGGFADIVACAFAIALIGCGVSAIAKAFK